jgi:hypothetical protein
LLCLAFRNECRYNYWHIPPTEAAELLISSRIWQPVVCREEGEEGLNYANIQTGWFVNLHIFFIFYEPPTSFIFTSVLGKQFLIFRRNALCLCALRPLLNLYFLCGHYNGQAESKDMRVQKKVVQNKELCQERQTGKRGALYNTVLPSVGESFPMYARHYFLCKHYLSVHISNAT